MSTTESRQIGWLHIKPEYTPPPPPPPPSSVYSNPFLDMFFLLTQWMKTLHRMNETQIKNAKEDKTQTVNVQRTENPQFSVQNSQATLPVRTVTSTPFYIEHI
jgi:hypothetical protein